MALQHESVGPGEVLKAGTASWCAQRSTCSLTPLLAGAFSLTVRRPICPSPSTALLHCCFLLLPAARRQAIGTATGHTCHCLAQGQALCSLVGCSGGGVVGPWGPTHTHRD